ncbi:MAG TPA: cell division topological specificity factor MinE [Pelotomaculum sp.]|uniref:cell division topological specificity factor MinE n=1 Tax=Pelotomaculum sp. FP TaxID=261474 RepID=UPI000E86D772|nr:cell division topological specificity factor MinE [Pelotomaculum sp. FP]TEB16458.1 Cell division topological specificity factor [Pelotomaculum sp. FP]HBC91777.1 cell division topological specificity factor MinE [Pelotomaculum sp.]
MLDLLKRVFSRDSGSKHVAKERLRLVLVHDRSSISPQLLETLRSELIQVISNYMDIDENGLEVSLDSSGNTVALVANIPVVGMKRTGTAY